MMTSFAATGFVTIVYGPPEPQVNSLLLPSHVVRSVGNVTGMKPQRASAAQVLVIPPATAVASADAVNAFRPTTPPKNVLKLRDPVTRTPAASAGGGLLPRLPTPVGRSSPVIFV